jgi:hypothetical protein
VSDAAQSTIADYIAEEMMLRFPGVSPDVLVACTMKYAADRIPEFADAAQAALDDYAARLYLALESYALAETMRRKGLRPC